MTKEINSKIFRAYDIRGICPNELNEEIAQKIGTINYEIVHMPDKKRVPKLFIKNGKPCKIKTMLEEKLL